MQTDAWKCAFAITYSILGNLCKKLSNAKVTDSKQTYYNPQQIHTQ